MAKVILVTDKVNSTSWPLALSLRAQQHEVIFLTSYGETLKDDDQGVRFFPFFKSWSLLEAMKLLPRLFTYEPQILHLILDKTRLKPAHAVLASYAKSHPLMVLTTSLLHLEKRLGPRNPLRLLLQESDIVTCPSVEALAKLRGLSVRSKRQGRGILPPALDLYESSLVSEILVEEPASATHKNWSARLSEAPFFVVPCLEKTFSPEVPFFQRLRRIAETHFVILLGSSHEWPLRQRRLFEEWMHGQGLHESWMFSGDLSAQQEKELFRQTASLILAGIPLSAEEISQYYLKAIQCNTPLVLDSKQASVHAHLWQKNINCWILNHEVLDKDLRIFLQQSTYRPPESLQQMLSQDRHLTATPLNELNRLYSRALAQLK